jgi:hypothetical protein
VLEPGKHMYGQAFALYAPAEYSMATGSREAMSLALRLFDLQADEHAHALDGGVHGLCARRRPVSCARGSLKRSPSKVRPSSYGT